eukprot:1787477-Rhodomonas_salina.1
MTTTRLKNYMYSGRWYPCPAFTHSRSLVQSNFESLPGVLRVPRVPGYPGRNFYPCRKSTRARVQGARVHVYPAARLWNVALFHKPPFADPTWYNGIL